MQSSSFYIFAYALSFISTYIFIVFAHLLNYILRNWFLFNIVNLRIQNKQISFGIIYKLQFIHIREMKKILLIMGLLAVAMCTLGIDLSTLTSVDSFKCFRNEGRTFVIARAWRSYASFDTNVLQTISNALQAGFKESEIGVYMFPCYSETKTPESQAAEMISSLGNAKYSAIWLDMQTNTSPNCGWSKDFDKNCQFSEKLAIAAAKSGKKVGIYASNYMWNQIMGGTDRCPKFVHLPLWYAHYDNVPSIQDFKPFGGWTKPYAKQYKGTTAMCSASVDLNFIP